MRALLWQRRTWCVTSSLRSPLGGTQIRQHSNDHHKDLHPAPLSAKPVDHDAVPEEGEGQEQKSENGPQARFEDAGEPGRC